MIQDTARVITLANDTKKLTNTKIVLFKYLLSNHFHLLMRKQAYSETCLNLTPLEPLSETCVHITQVKLSKIKGIRIKLDV